MNTTILRALLKKELLLMRRNPMVPRIMLMLPLMVMLVVPLVATMDVKNVAVCVVDLDRSELSRRLVSDVDAPAELRVAAVVSSGPEALELIESGEADAVLTIPARFERNLTRGEAPKLLLEVNGVNATKGGIGGRYVAEAAGGTLRRFAAVRGAELPVETLSQLNLYNPTLDFRNYMIPALMVMLVIIICGFLPALNIVGEKESGTMEAMNVTPVGRFTFVISKLLPYWVAGLAVVTIGMIVGRAVYGLTPQGGIGAIYLATVLFSLVMSSLGVTIANKSATMLQSIFLMFAVIMVFQLMSGLFTPVSSMPGWARAVTYAIPPRYFIEIMRGVYLRGAGITDLWVQFAALGGIAALLCVIAASTYKKRS